MLKNKPKFIEVYSCRECPYFVRDASGADEANWCSEFKFFFAGDALQTEKCRLYTIQQIWENFERGD